MAQSQIYAHRLACFLGSMTDHAKWLVSYVHVTCHGESSVKPMYSLCMYIYSLVNKYITAWVCFWGSISVFLTSIKLAKMFKQ